LAEQENIEITKTKVSEDIAPRIDELEAEVRRRDMVTKEYDLENKNIFTALVSTDLEIPFPRYDMLDC